MGYPPSQRGYCACDVQTYQFFTSGNIIFDENIPYCAHHEVTSDADYSTLPLSADSPTDASPLPVTPPHTQSSIQVPSQSLKAKVACSPRPQRTKVLTEAGQAYAQKMLEAKEHLSQLREAAVKRAELKSAANGSNIPLTASEPEGLSGPTLASATPGNTASVKALDPSNAVCMPLEILSPLTMTCLYHQKLTMRQRLALALPSGCEWKKRN